MNKVVTISWAILACNETDTLETLLDAILNHANADDEIVLVLDENNYSDDTLEIVKNRYEVAYSTDEYPPLMYFFHPLNNNFASQKNFMNHKCNCDYIFNLDADEMLSEVMFQSVYTMLTINCTVEAFWIPRINTVKGITPDHLKRWRWVIDDKGRINYPDPQLRLYKNLPNIRWEREIHEFLTGFSTYAQFPYQDEYCIIHEKDISRQEKQNALYNKIYLDKVK